MSNETLAGARISIKDFLAKANKAAGKFFGTLGDDNVSVITVPGYELETAARQELEHSKVTITTQEQYNTRCEDLKRVTQLIKDGEAQRKEITVPIDEAKKVVQAAFSEPMEFLRTAQDTLKRAIGEYADKVERARQLEAAENQRKAREASERLAGRADNAEDTGNVEKAQVLRQQSEKVTVSVAPVVAPVEQVKGISTRKNYKAEVFDLMALVQAVAAGKAPLATLQADMKALDAQAKALKENFTPDKFGYPGVRVVAENVVATRTK